MAKNDYFHEDGKVGSSNAIPTKLFSVDFYDLKFMSFKFGNAIFNTFEIPRSSYLMSVGKFTFCCYSVHLHQKNRLSICKNNQILNQFLILT